MKKSILLTAAVVTAGAALAQDVGRVLSATPVMQQVEIPRQVCSTERIAVQPRKSGAGAVMGAITGGALGNAIGNGGGRTAATLLGLIGGAAVGNSLEGSQRTKFQDVQRCETQTFLEAQPVAYNVVYEYAGRQYAVQTPQDPGPTIALQITPVMPIAQTLAPQAAVATAPQYGYDRQTVVPDSRGGYLRYDDGRYERAGSPYHGYRHRGYYRDPRDEQRQ